MRASIRKTRLSMLAMGLAANAALAVTEGPALRLMQTVPLPQVAGRIDHFAIDPAGPRLFVAALGSGSVEVIDLRTAKVISSIRDLPEPQGIYYLANPGRLYVANGGDGSVRVFDGKSLAPLASIPCGDDADNLRYDASTRRLYVGYGGGAIGVIDVTNNRKIADFPVSAHPESFQLERAGSRIFVNLPGAHTVAVLDRQRGTRLGAWSTGLASANYPMALDEAGHRLWVACRLPARLLQFDTGTGKEIARFDLHGDCDDLFFDDSGRLYASCGEGYIDVFAPKDSGHHERVESIATEKGARTCFLDGDRLYLAVPKRGDKSAELRCYSIGGGLPDPPRK